MLNSLDEYYYYAPVFTDPDGIRWPGSVDAQVEVLEWDPDLGEMVVTEVLTQFGQITIPGGRYYYDPAVPRFVVKSPAEQTFSDWTAVTVDQVIDDYGSKVV